MATPRLMGSTPFFRHVFERRETLGRPARPGEPGNSSSWTVVIRDAPHHSRSSVTEPCRVLKLSDSVPPLLRPPHSFPAPKSNHPNPRPTHRRRLPPLINPRGFAATRPAPPPQFRFWAGVGEPRSGGFFQSRRGLGNRGTGFAPSPSPRRERTGRWGGGASRSPMTSPRSSASSARTAATSASATSSEPLPPRRFFFFPFHRGLFICGNLRACFLVVGDGTGALLLLLFFFPHGKRDS